MLFNCGAGEDSWVSLVKQGVQTTLSQRTSTLNIHWKDWCWNWSCNTLATWFEEPTHWKRSWCWERLNVGWEGDDRGRDGWMASQTQWTWFWASSGRQWKTGKPVCSSPWGCRVRHNWAAEQEQQIELVEYKVNCILTFKMSNKHS